MNYGEIKNCDIANGIGVRVSLFVSGCRNHCKDCFNPMTWAFDYGKEFTNYTKEALIDSLKKDYIEGLTILGGEPFEPENQEQVLELIKEVRKEVPNKTIWVYSGFTYEELMGVEQSRASLPSAKEILNLVDILVDGKFVEELKDIRLKFRGSSNQRIIDMKETNKQGKIVLSSLNK